MLACGCPVVATNVGGIPEILVDNTLGLLVEPENPTALANAVNQALGCEWDREHLHKYSQQFTWGLLKKYKKP